MHVTFSTQVSGFEQGKIYSNPMYFSRLRDGTKSVTVIGDYPAIVAACKKAGIDCKVEGGKAKPVKVDAPVEPKNHDGGITIERGPRGFWFHLKDGERISKGFATEQEAKDSIETPSHSVVDKDREAIIPLKRDDDGKFVYSDISSKFKG